MNQLTARQQAIANGYAPTVREIGCAVGLASVSSVHAQLAVLEAAAGRIVRRPGAPRTLRVVEQAVRL